MNEITSFNSFDEAKQGELQQWEFPNERKAKQFLKDVANAGVAIGDLMQKNKKQVIIEILPGNPKVIDSAIAKYSKQNGGKRFNQGRSGPWSKTKRVGESVELGEDSHWVLMFQFHSPEYTSKEGRAIQTDLDKKFKTYSGNGSGGGGWDCSFNGSKKELEKAKKYVESKYKKYIESKETQFVMDESVEHLDEALTLASDNLNLVIKTAEKLSKQSPDLTYYVVKHNERYMKGMKYAYYEVYQSVDMHLVRGKVKKIAGYGAKVDMRESIELDEGKMKEFFMDIHDELEKAMDKKWYREMQSSNGAQGLDNIISNTHKQLYGKGDPDPKDIADAIIAKYGRNHKEYMKLSLDMMRRNESVELDEGVDSVEDTVDDTVDESSIKESSVKECSVMNSYVKFLSKDINTQSNKSARLSLDARTLDARRKDV